MVLIEAVKNGRPMTKVMAPLIVYNKDGSLYREEIHRIYYEEKVDI